MSTPTIETLIARLAESGTGEAKLAIVRRAADGAELSSESVDRIAAALRQRGHAQTANKVLAICAEAPASVPSAEPTDEHAPMPGTEAEAASTDEDGEPSPEQAASGERGMRPRRGR